METHEGTTAPTRSRVVRLAAAATAVVSALALATPAVAGNRSKSPTTTQDPAMATDCSDGGSGQADATVSWSDVSWADSSTAQ